MLIINHNLLKLKYKGDFVIKKIKKALVLGLTCLTLSSVVTPVFAQEQTKFKSNVSKELTFDLTMPIKQVGIVELKDGTPFYISVEPKEVKTKDTIPAGNSSWVIKGWNLLYSMAYEIDVTYNNGVSKITDIYGEGHSFPIYEVTNTKTEISPDKSKSYYTINFKNLINGSMTTSLVAKVSGDKLTTEIRW